MPQPFAACAIAVGRPAGSENSWLAEPAISQGRRTAADSRAGAIAVREGAGRPLNSLERLCGARPHVGARSALSLKAAESCSVASALPSAATEAPQACTPEAAYAAATALQSALAAPLLDLRRQRALRRVPDHGSRRNGSTRCGRSHRQQTASPNHCQQSGSHSALLSAMPVPQEQAGRRFGAGGPHAT